MKDQLHQGKNICPKCKQDIGWNGLLAWMRHELDECPEREIIVISGDFEVSLVKRKNLDNGKKRTNTKD